MYRIRNTNQFMTGVFLIAVSALAFYLAYPLSNITEVGIGPGFVPNMLAGVQLVFGGLLIAEGFTKDGEAPERWQLRPLLVLAAIAFFGLTIESLGLAIALTGLVLISCAAHRGTKFREALAVAVGSVVFSDVVFMRLLGLSIQMWPPQTGWGF